MTNLAEVIVLADHALSQRKRARRFWGTMGVMLRFDERRNTQVDNRSAGDPRAMRKTAFETRAPRARS